MRQSLLIFTFLLMLIGQSVAQKKKSQPAASEKTSTTAPMLAEQFMDKLMADESQLQKLQDILIMFLTRAQDVNSTMERQTDGREAVIKEIYEKRFNDYMELLNDAGKKELMIARNSSPLFDLNNMQQFLSLNPAQVNDIFLAEMNFMIKQLELEQGADLTASTLRNQRREIFDRRVAAIRSILTPAQIEKLRVIEAGSNKKKEVPGKGKASSSAKGN